MAQESRRTTEDLSGVAVQVQRAATARAAVAEVAVGPAPAVLITDLSSQEQIHTLAEDMHERYEHIDVLINNAGPRSRRATSGSRSTGYERTLGRGGQRTWRPSSTARGVDASALKPGARRGVDGDAQPPSTRRNLQGENCFEALRRQTRGGDPGCPTPTPALLNAPLGRVGSQVVASTFVQSESTALLINASVFAVAFSSRTSWRAASRRT